MRKDPEMLTEPLKKFQGNLGIPRMLPEFLM